jgi:3-deoxy-7-phosphoheptulonate synthase
MQKTSDINVVETRALPSPARCSSELPKTDAQAEFVTRARREIHRLIFTDDKRFLLIVGPCSIHDLDAGRDYARARRPRPRGLRPRDDRHARVL